MQFTHFHISKVPQKWRVTHPQGQSLSPSKVRWLNWTQTLNNSNVTKARLPPASSPFRLKPDFQAAARCQAPRAHSPLPAGSCPGRPRAGAVRHRTARPWPRWRSAPALQEVGEGQRGELVAPLRSSLAEKGTSEWGLTCLGRETPDGLGQQSRFYPWFPKWLQWFVRGRWEKTMIKSLHSETAISFLGG